MVRAALISSQLVNEDTSLLWVGARDWAHGRVGQPNFYGQSYGSMLESIPIALLHALRVPYWTGTPFVLAMIEWLGWVLLAVAAWRRGRRVMAVVAVAIPVVLSAYHTVYAAMIPDAPLPRLLVIAGVALLVSDPKRRLSLAFVAMLLGVGLQFDPSAALVALPAVVWWATTTRRTRPQLEALAAGAVPPLGLFVFTKLFYVRHPDYAFHTGPSLRVSGSTLTNSSHHLGDLFSLYAPELWRSWLVPVAVLVVLVAALVATRKLAYAVPALLVALIVLYAMATPKAASTLGVLLPRGRVLLALPATLWFLGLLSVEAGVWRAPAGKVTRRQVLVAVVVLCVSSSAVRLVDFEGRVGYWRAKSIALRNSPLTYGFESRPEVVRSCRADIDYARRHDIGLLVYSDRVATYVCASLSTRIETITPNYERRTWLLYRELTHPRTSLVMADVHATWCALAAPRATCAWADGRATLTFAAQPALPLLASLGVGIRGFGPSCHPETSFAVLCRGHSADLTRHPFGPPPMQSDAARSDIVAAYRDMFDVHSGRAPLASVEAGASYDDVARALRDVIGNPPMPVVTSVVFLDDHEAVVRFHVGSTALTGEAMAENGHWRVAAPTFCSSIVEVFAERKQLYGTCDTTRFR
ncbi:MAG: hypothetical protein QOH28_3912 [Actinomycetota bacterium]|nr:hypothetical protein [Actinomycetota bacterium]